MKMSKILLILFSFLCFHSIGYCECSGKVNLNQKIYWGSSSPNSVAEQANKRSPFSTSPDSPYAEPMLIDPLGAYGTMLQMMNPGTTYNNMDIQRQQMDYVKQQISE